MEVIMQIGFDNNKYLKTQSEHIRERIGKFGGKLYLEFGGKLFDDYHASRVLPGFEPDSKITMLCELKDQAEIVVAINAADIEKNKVRGDLGITYDEDLLRLVDAFTSHGLYVGSVVLTRFANQPSAVAYEKKLQSLGLKVYRHYPIAGYPADIPLIVSDEGYGRNDYIETTRPLVVVTAPGPGSGKMATCLSQLYHENRRGVKAGYAKFETFPVWNLPLNHPVNLAYEAATADLDDMGVNMVGFCISDDDVCKKAARQEIIRRYYDAECEFRKGNESDEPVHRIELLMKKSGIEISERPVVMAANLNAEKTGAPAAAMEMADGTILTGRTSELLGASSALLLNALKKLAGVPDQVKLISPEIIAPIMDMKIDHLGSDHTSLLHLNELLIALAIAGVTDPNAKAAIGQLENLRGLEVHSSVILSQIDSGVFKKLGVNLTCEPHYESNKLYHK